MKNKLKKMFRNLLLSSALLALTSTQPARAGDQAQTYTNLLAAFSTNTIRVLPDVSGTYTNGEAPSAASIVCAKGQHVWLECGGIFTNAGAGPSNITFRISGSVSGNQWSNNYASVVFAVPVGTNYASGTILIQNAMPFMATRAIENINTANVTARRGSMYLKAYVKDGI